MVRCERCGSGFSYIRGSANEYCPRCQARDGATVPLTGVEAEPVAGDSSRPAAGRSSDGEDEARSS
jgi:hypothetical protein